MPTEAGQAAAPAIDLSIVVAAHNEERLLPRCLDSIEAQLADARIEVVLVDNGCTDRTAEIASSRPFVRVVRETRLGAVFAKATGVAAAQGTLVAILDADSICPPRWIRRITERFAAEPDLVGLTGPARYEGGAFWVPAVIWCWYLWWRFTSVVAKHAVYATGTNVAFRRDAYLKSSGFDTQVLVGGDEVSLFSALSKVGITRYDPTLIVDTDARRLNVGFFRFVLEIFFLRYVVNYTYYRLTGRSLFSSYRPGSTLVADNSRSTTRSTQRL